MNLVLECLGALIITTVIIFLWKTLIASDQKLLSLKRQSIDYLKNERSIFIIY